MIAAKTAWSFTEKARDRSEKNEIRKFIKSFNELESQIIQRANEGHSYLTITTLNTNLDQEKIEKYARLYWEKFGYIVHFNKVYILISWDKSQA